MGRILANFQHPLSYSGLYQIPNKFKKGEGVSWSVDQATTNTASDGTVSVEVVERVADIEDVDPIELPRLYEVINPDALDQVFATTPTAGREGGQVTFSYHGYEITVSSDGDVSVEE